MKTVITFSPENLKILKKIVKNFGKQDPCRPYLSNFKLMKLNEEEVRILATNGHIAHDLIFRTNLDREELQLPFSIFKDMKDNECSVIQEVEGNLIARNGNLTIRLLKNGEVPAIERVCNLEENDEQIRICLDPKLLAQFITKGDFVTLCYDANKPAGSQLVVDPSTGKKVGVIMMAQESNIKKEGK